MEFPMSQKLMPDYKVWRDRYNVTAMTGWRWDRDPDLGFPKPVYIQGRKYRNVDELDAFDERQRQKSGPTRKPPRGLGQPRKPTLNT
jgi:hypothetical protein